MPDKPINILNKLQPDSNFIDVIAAFTEAQVVSNTQLKVIAQNTTDQVAYFKDKDGFSKEMDSLFETKLDAKLKILENKLVIKFFSIVGFIAIILGAVIKLTG